MSRECEIPVLWRYICRLFLTRAWSGRNILYKWEGNKSRPDPGFSLSCFSHDGGSSIPGCWYFLGDCLISSLYFMLHTSCTRRISYICTFIGCDIQLKHSWVAISFSSSLCLATYLGVTVSVHLWLCLRMFSLLAELVNVDCTGSMPRLEQGCDGLFNNANDIFSIYTLLWNAICLLFSFITNAVDQIQRHGLSLSGYLSYDHCWLIAIKYILVSIAGGTLLVDNAE